MIAERCYRELANVGLRRFPPKMAMVVLLQLSEVNSRDFVEESIESSFHGLRKKVRGLTVPK